MLIHHATNSLKPAWQYYLFHNRAIFLLKTSILSLKTPSTPATRTRWSKWRKVVFDNAACLLPPSHRETRSRSRRRRRGSGMGGGGVRGHSVTRYSVTIFFDNDETMNDPLVRRQFNKENWFCSFFFNNYCIQHRIAVEATIQWSINPLPPHVPLCQLFHVSGVYHMLFILFTPPPDTSHDTLCSPFDTTNPLISCPPLLVIYPSSSTSRREQINAN